MNCTITIGGVSKALQDAGNDWIASQLNGRRKDGPVCVQVVVKAPGVDISLATSACASSGGGGGGGRQATPEENQLFALWNEKRLNDADFSLGNLLSFVNEMRRKL